MKCYFICPKFVFNDLHDDQHVRFTIKSGILVCGGGRETANTNTYADCFPICHGTFYSFALLGSGWWNGTSPLKLSRYRRRQRQKNIFLHLFFIQVSHLLKERAEPAEYKTWIMSTAEYPCGSLLELPEPDDHWHVSYIPNWLRQCAAKPASSCPGQNTSLCVIFGGHEGMWKLKKLEEF